MLMTTSDLVFGCLISATLGAFATIVLVATCSDFYTAMQLNKVGIKEIRKCSIDTTTAKSNWYEIVWMDGFNKKGERK